MISEHRTGDFHLTGLALSAHRNIQWNFTETDSRVARTQRLQHGSSFVKGKLQYIIHY